MKLYLVSPNIPEDADRDAVHARLQACIEPIAELIASYVDTDPALFALRVEGEVTEAPVLAEFTYGPVQAVWLKDGRAVRGVLREIGNPSGGKWALVRSLATCRAVSYGYDGQAFVCLTETDPPLISPDENLIVVEECSHWLAESDWMDGLLILSEADDDG